MNYHAVAIVAAVVNQNSVRYTGRDRNYVSAVHSYRFPVDNVAVSAAYAEHDLDVYVAMLSKLSLLGRECDPARQGE